MEGLQTNHHVPRELDIDAKPLALRSVSIGYHFLYLCSEKKRIHSFTHRPQPAPTAPKNIKKDPFFLNISLQLKLSADTLL